MTYVELGRKELRRDYPFVKGLTKGTETQEGRVMNLVAEKSIVPKDEEVGMK